MRHPDLLAPRFDLDLDEAASFERIDGRGPHQRHEVVERDGLADGDELHHLAFVVGEGTEPEADDLTESGRRGQGPGQAPQPAADVAERARVARTDDELAQEQRVAAARAPEGVGAHPVDGSSHRARDQLGRGVGVEGRDLDPLEELVLPQGGDRVGGVRTGPDRHDEEHLRG